MFKAPHLNSGAFSGQRNRLQSKEDNTWGQQRAEGAVYQKLSTVWCDMVALAVFLWHILGAMHFTKSPCNPLKFSLLGGESKDQNSLSSNFQRQSYQEQELGIGTQACLSELYIVWVEFSIETLREKRGTPKFKFT